MYEIFTKLLNMSLLAGILVVAIILLRILFKRIPKKYMCLLWVMVAFRLVCPFSIQSPLSVFNLMNSHVTSNNQIEYFQYNEKPEKPEKPVVTFEIPTFVYADSADVTVQEENSLQIYLPILMNIWVIGLCVMLISAIISYVKLRKSVSISIKRKDNIFVCDEINSPFILGVMNPRIYLPSGIEQSVEKHVIAHEQAHLKRRDYLWKPLGYLLLSVYWFNPLLWIAYILFCRDIEAACDEKVIKDLDKENKIGYSEALLACAVQRRTISVCPIAFGETNVKGRIKNVLNYKKPTFWIIIATIVVCCIFSICLLTDPNKKAMPDNANNTMLRFFAYFEEANYTAMAELCTKECQDSYFHEEDVFGYKRAAVLNYSEEKIGVNTYKYQINVQVEATPQSAIYPSTETTFSVYVVNQDGKWYVSGFSTD